MHSGGKASIPYDTRSVGSTEAAKCARLHARYKSERCRVSSSGARTHHFRFSFDQPRCVRAPLDPLAARPRFACRARGVAVRAILEVGNAARIGPLPVAAKGEHARRRIPSNSRAGDLCLGVAGHAFLPDPGITKPERSVAWLRHLSHAIHPHSWYSRLPWRMTEPIRQRACHSGQTPDFVGLAGRIADRIMCCST